VESIVHDSERLVFQALKQLPDGYVVIHSFPWLRPLRDLESEPLREGEADFVILHPNRGMLVMEVKGGQPELKNLTWTRGGKRMRDPFSQAQRNRYALLDALEERTQGRINRKMLTHGDVVVFPHVRYQGALPVNADARIFVDAGGLRDLPARLEDAFEAWTKQPTQLTPSQFHDLLEALLPKLRLLRCVGAELESERARIVQVTEDQRATLLGLLEEDRVLVEGGAGSGKTLLALEFALVRADAGEKILLLCYNRHLANWLTELVKADSRSQRSVGSVEVDTFHGLALSLAKRAGVEFRVPENDAEAFWDDEAPLILEQALEVLRAHGRSVVFDAVVVDEAQDFARDWWVTVESLTRGGRNGRLYVFLDLNQSLRREPRLPAVPLQAPFKLRTNCRNTRAIARSGAQLAKLRTVLLPGIPEGEPPALRRSATSATGSGIVLEEVRRLLADGVSPAQLALVGPAGYRRGSLARFAEVAGVPFTDDAAAWRRGEGILVTTSRAFKGLEADVVVIYDLSTFSQTFTRTDLYVAWTRARHRLIVACHGTEVRTAVEEALSRAAEAEGKVSV
jgi:hypothetical protein